MRKKLYIVINHDWKIGDVNCQIGQTISQKEGIRNFNFKCFVKLRDCLLEENLKNKHICKVEVVGDIKKNKGKVFTNKIRILEEIDKEKIKKALLDTNR